MSGADGLLAWGLAAAGPVVALAALTQGLARARRAFALLVAGYGAAVALGALALAMGTGARPGAGFVLVAGFSALVVSGALFALGHKVGRKA